VTPLATQARGWRLQSFAILRSQSATHGLAVRRLPAALSDSLFARQPLGSATKEVTT
jgi:hypothetical protein